MTPPGTAPPESAKERREERALGPDVVAQETTVSKMRVDLVLGRGKSSAAWRGHSGLEAPLARHMPSAGPALGTSMTGR